MGIQYQGNFTDKGNLSVYAGYRAVWGTLGLPGYKAMDTAQIPFTLHMPEGWASFGWFF